jgi:hypothetical protein
MVEPFLVLRSSNEINKCTTYVSVRSWWPPPYPRLGFTVELLGCYRSSLVGHPTSVGQKGCVSVSRAPKGWLPCSRDRREIAMADLRCWRSSSFMFLTFQCGGRFGRPRDGVGRRGSHRQFTPDRRMSCGTSRPGHNLPTTLDSAHSSTPPGAETAP